MSDMSPDVFNWKGPPNTSVIDLSSNRLTNLNFVTQLFAKLQNSQAFKLLNLSSNNLTELKPGTFLAYPRYLATLDLSNNSIAVIDPCAFSWEELIGQTGDMHPRLRLHSNPLDCSECSANFWMYRTFYEPNGPYRWSVQPEGAIDCSFGLPVSYYFQWIRPCTREIVCYNSAAIDFGSLALPGTSSTAIIIQILSAMTGVMVCIALGCCCYKVWQQAGSMSPSEGLEVSEEGVKDTFSSYGMQNWTSVKTGDKEEDNHKPRKNSGLQASMAGDASHATFMSTLGNSQQPLSHRGSLDSAVPMAGRKLPDPSGGSGFFKSSQATSSKSGRPQLTAQAESTVAKGSGKSKKESSKTLKAQPGQSGPDDPHNPINPLVPRYSLPSDKTIPAKSNSCRSMPLPPTPIELTTKGSNISGTKKKTSKKRQQNSRDSSTAQP